MLYAYAGGTEAVATATVDSLGHAKAPHHHHPASTNRRRHEMSLMWTGTCITLPEDEGRGMLTGEWGNPKSQHLDTVVVGPTEA